jgi:hypothetical protein
MKSTSAYAIRCLAGGVIVLTLFTLLTFWLRTACLELGVDEEGPHQREYEVQLSPLPVMPAQFESEPNVVKHSGLAVKVFTQIDILRWMGLSDELLDTRRIDPDVYEWNHGRGGSVTSWLYFDRKLGLFVYCAPRRTFDPNAISDAKTEWYAGPEGMAQAAETSLGRFESPIASRLMAPMTTYVYDARLRRFFKLDWRGQQVAKGPEMEKDDVRQPVRLEGRLGKLEPCLSMRTEPPMRDAGTKASGDPNLIPVVGLRGWGGRDAPISVLDASGRIEMLDPATLTITAVAGYLPSIEGLFGSTERSPVRGLLAYQMQPLWLWTRSRTSQYLGYGVAAINRDASRISVAVFNDRGTLAGSVTSEIPGGPAFTTTRYLLENLHPPVLSVLSEITAPYIGARAGGHGLFVLPDSLVAARGRVLSEMWVVRIAGGLGLIAPSLLLVAILAWLVARDARLFGLSKNKRTLWILTIALFGIPACITYVLMRPRMVLVTCRNCGKPRRPDRERCQRCDSPWDVPELNPPAWRVFDGEAPEAIGTTAKPRTEAEQNADSSVNIM